MPELALALPVCRPELVVGPLGDHGAHVVKNPSTGEYYHLGAEEHFLLTQLDGRQSEAAIGAAFLERFGEPLAQEDFAQFLEMVQAHGLVQAAAAQGPTPAGCRPSRRQSLLCWRKTLFDPNRFFSWLEPRLWFFWTRGFLVVSAGCLVLAVGLVWANQEELSRSFLHALRWETLVLVGLTLLVVTMLHE